MVCKQVAIYITYIVIQTIVSIGLLGSIAIPSLADLLGPLLGIGIIHLLCKRKSFTVASVLVGLTVSVGVLSDLLCFSNLKCCGRFRGKIIEGAKPLAPAQKEKEKEKEKEEVQEKEEEEPEPAKIIKAANADAERAAQAAIRYKELSIARINQQKALHSPDRRRVLFDRDSKRLYRKQQKQMNQYQENKQYATPPYANVSDQDAPQWADSNEWLGSS